MSFRRPMNPLYSQPSSLLDYHHNHHHQISLTSQSLRDPPSHHHSTPSSPYPTPTSPPSSTNIPASDARPQEPPIPGKEYYPNQPKSLAGIALRAFLLGTAFTTGLVSLTALLLTTSSPLWRLPFFLSALSLFHFLEFWTTAAYNTPQATVHAFLLTANWPAYAIAHATAFAECLIANLAFPGAVWAPFGLRPAFLAAGLALAVTGQTVRSAAMVTAGQSFNHTVQHYRAESHILVTGGIYGWLRHPSYFGFFWWAIGTQLVMGNLVSLAAYAVVLWYFFAKRIRHEEELLVRFFGQEYVDYRKRVGIMIPFCG
ncbi:isoprenylcysteine carboxyl methyltransferase [Colletotrichum orchidophilum]|uniref:Protein-S-isoprenylcysteine O-methyltransferase n=1 Tax=Colletotrichum orchidophilum TaxID=1209926 RepID=A0A1G4BMX4_9PEZI|nr:isoprenylcysteine carboxyl methyltransferase [Colletotrichum orchidophilum]OHF02658.1 isoprenylcysteine carboxyl methyltransferase [Colletotrichum orchidophilum]